MFGSCDRADDERLVIQTDGRKAVVNLAESLVRAHRTLCRVNLRGAGRGERRSGLSIGRGNGSGSAARHRVPILGAELRLVGNLESAKR